MDEKVVYAVIVGYDFSTRNTSMGETGMNRLFHIKAEKDSGLIKKNISSRYNFDLTVMALPGIAFFLLFCYLPMFGIILAFKEYNFTDGIFLSPWAGFKNFEFFFTSSDASRITFNTLFLNFILL